ncbi:scopoletin glucosyltransferase-like, partial [Populus nigra]|uniref:scopoletin glucosyltransferase-like n=1 Tax=Populus nigra TaxID=3691 RepID=UPI002B26D217
NIKTIKFPAVEVGLPEGCENTDSITSHETKREMTKKLFMATTMLQQPLEKLLQECHPDCLIADMFLPWTTDAVAKFGIPRLVFHGISCFSLCTSDCLNKYMPYKKSSSNSELFVVLELPGDIKFRSKHLPEYMKQNVETDFTRLIQKVRESSVKIFGIIVNSFYELELDYANFFKELGRKAWHIGPISLCNREFKDKAQKGKKALIDKHECLKWLDSKKPNSVVYICFGTVAIFSDSQLKEIVLNFLEGPVMEVEASFSHISSPIFNGENYQLWAVRMETYLEALDLWEAIEEDYDVPPLPNNPTMAQIKSHRERKTKKSKSKSMSICCYFNNYFHKNHVS